MFLRDYHGQHYSSIVSKQNEVNVEISCLRRVLQYLAMQSRWCQKKVPAPQKRERIYNWHWICTSYNKTLRFKAVIDHVFWLQENGSPHRSKCITSRIDQWSITFCFLDAIICAYACTKYTAETCCSTLHTWPCYTTRFLWPGKRFWWNDLPMPGLCVQNVAFDPSKAESKGVLSAVGSPLWRFSCELDDIRAKVQSLFFPAFPMKEPLKQSFYAVEGAFCRTSLVNELSQMQKKNMSSAINGPVTVCGPCYLTERQTLQIDLAHLL